MTPQRISIATDDGQQLEARWDVPRDPRSAIVFCHPHPLHGGTLTAPLMHGVTKHLVSQDFAVLRFNFRGVGGSTGEWSGGRGEVADVAAAMRTAEERMNGDGLALAGWSFGAATALRWQAEAGSDAPYVGIAPPVSSELTPPLPEPESLVPAQRAFILGDRDQFVTVEQLCRYAGAIDADVHVLAGSDHFFHFREDRVAAEIVTHFSGGVIAN